MISKQAKMRREEYKFRSLEMILKIKDQQLKMIIYVYIYIHILLYLNLMVTTRQKSTIDTHQQKEKGIQT